MDKVSEKLKSARLAKGITIEEIAEATLLSPSVVRDIEDGNFKLYAGDELYVKMYIKKIANYLGIDESIANEYYAITREIKLTELKEKQEKETDTTSTTFVDKMSEFSKNIQQSTTVQKPKRTKRVYEDHYILRYIKYIIVILLIVAIIAVIGYSLVFTRSNDSSFNQSNTTQVEGTVETKKDTKKETTKKKEDTTKQDTTKQDEASTQITFTKNADGDYSFKLPDNYKEQTFKLKVDFTFPTTVDLHVNGDPNTYAGFKRGVYSNSLGDISASQALLPDSACESVDNIEFNVADFQYLEFNYSWNIGHRYYINGQQIPLEESDHKSTSNGIKTFKLTLVK